MKLESELRFSTIGGLVVGMALATAAFYDPLPWWLPVPLLVLAIWRLYPAWRGRSSPEVGRWIKFSLLAAMVLVLWASGHLGLGLEGAGGLFIILLWSKLLELRAARDLQRTCAIALFLVSAQLLVSQSLAQCLFALASSIALLAVLVQWHLTGVRGSNFSDPAPLRTWWRSCKICLVLAAQALPFAVVLFICLPRPTLTPGYDRHSGQSGISDHLAPGELAHLALSHELAFRVTFTGGIQPPTSDLYWRGIVLWSTDGESWGRHLNGQSHEIPFEHRSEVGAGQDISYEVTLQPQNQRWIYTLDCPMRVDDSGFYRYLPKIGYSWESVGMIGSTRLYSATSRLIPASDQPRATGIDYLSVNAGDDLDPRIYQLRNQLKAASITATGKVDPALAVQATLRWFADNGFVYTLDPGELGPHPIESFLFVKRRGFCEHYASAFSVIMRLLGVRSRVVVGYCGGEYNPVGGFLDVRQSHAHAWSEVWIPGEGWRRVDPTREVPALDQSGNPIQGDQRFDPAAMAPSGSHWFADHLQGLSQRWDYIEAEWDRWALAYDEDALSGLMAHLHLQRLGFMAPLLLVAALLVPGLMGVSWYMRRRRYSQDAAVELWMRFDVLLASHGVVRLPSEGPLHFAKRASGEFPEQGPALLRFAEQYAALRYGPPQPPPARVQLIRRLRHDLRQLRLPMAGRGESGSLPPRS